MDVLYPAWQNLWQSLEAKADGLALFQQLVDRYSEAQRKYHTLQHLGECLDIFDHVRELAAAPVEVEMALWFHDAIYDPLRHDNEAQSAAWASSALLAAGVPVDRVVRIAGLVMVTRHIAEPVLPDEQLIVDIDLAILAAPIERFTEYEQQIRAEYAHVSDADFYPARQKILRGFLDRPRIFSTPRLHAEFETLARENLSRVLAA